MRRLSWLAATAAVVAATPSARAQRAPAGLANIDPIVVLYMENRSFDHLFGTVPGANGLADAGDAAIQVDENGKPYAALPTPLDLRKNPPIPYEKLPASIPNSWTRATAWVTSSAG